MREYGVEKCSEECGACKLVRDHPSLPWEWAAWGARKLNYCPSCGTRVGIDERGPWRVAMVPRAALEWLAGKRGWMGCPGEWDCEAWCDERCGSSDEEVAACWVRSALKAAKEANASE